MRSAASLGLAVAFVACGNYSDEDIPFYEALPASSQLHVTIPAANGQAICATHTSIALAAAQSAGGDINGGLEDILNLVDLIKSVPPSKREPDSRSWGPWNDTTHPGFETQVSMTEVDGGFTYDLDEGPKSTGDFSPLLTGSFSGGEAATGSGSLSLDFQTAWTLGIEASTDPHGPMTVDYDLGSDPQSIDLSLADAGLSLQAFDYHWLHASGGDGKFSFLWQDASGDVLTWTVTFHGDGSGVASATGTTSAGASVTVTECWDSSACVDYLQDPGNFTRAPECAANSPCTIGSPSACPTFPDGGT
jgi:hypothetical protein